MSTQKIKSVMIEENGGREKFKVVENEIGTPGKGEILIRHNAVGLNYIDVYHRTRIAESYAVNLPAVLGMEASGIVEKVGEGVSHLSEGDRAAYASAPPGAYCEARVMSGNQVCKLPDTISFEEGAAMMLKGLTVKYLFHDTTKINKGDDILFTQLLAALDLLLVSGHALRDLILSERQAQMRSVKWLWTMELFTLLITTLQILHTQ